MQLVTVVLLVSFGYSALCQSVVSTAGIGSEEPFTVGELFVFSQPSSISKTGFIPIVLGIPIPTTVSEGISPLKDLSIYPNPNNGCFYLESKSIIEYLLLTDISGSMVRSEINPTGKICLENGRPSGMFYLTVIFKDGCAAGTMVMVNN